MENIKKIEFEIEDIGCGLKMDRWHDLPQPKNEEGYKKQAKEKVYRDDKGEIAIPADAVRASMRYAASEVGKKMEAKKNRQTIKAQVFIEPTMLHANVKDFKIVRDIAVRGTGDKVTRIATYRPYIKEWKASGTMHLFGVPEEFAKECLQLAGMRYGLLSHRPDFGRFQITKWEVKDNGTKK